MVSRARLNAQFHTQVTLKSKIRRSVKAMEGKMERQVAIYRSRVRELTREKLVEL